MLHLHSALQKMDTTSMFNFQNLSQLSFFSPVKITYTSVLMFITFSYIEFWNVVPWKVLEKTPSPGENSLQQTYISIKTFVWKKEEKSTTRHFKELSAEISLIWTKSDPSKTLFFTVKKILLHLAPLCIFSHSSPIPQMPPLKLTQFSTISLQMFRIY